MSEYHKNHITSAEKWDHMKQYQSKLEAIKRMKPGRTYTLYTPYHYANFETATGTMIEKKRTLVRHYNGFARFKSKSGIGESYMYPDLVHYLQKPEGRKIISEKEALIGMRW